MLDFLRAAFPYVLAFLLPLAGLILAVARLAQGDRDGAARVLGAALLGVCLYAIVLT